MQDFAQTKETTKVGGSNTKGNKSPENFSKKGNCLGLCDRDVIFSKDGPVAVCHSCKRMLSRMN